MAGRHSMAISPMWALFALSVSLSAQDKITLIGAKDFPLLKVGSYAQFYKGTRCSSNGCIEVDGDKTGYEFGAAQTTFKGATGAYDVILSTCGDANGLCKYIVHVDGKAVGDEFTQTKYKEGGIEKATWKGVSIKQGATLLVLSNGSDSHRDPNGKGPNGFHMAHGRWTQVEFIGSASTALVHSGRPAGSVAFIGPSDHRETTDAAGRRSLQGGFSMGFLPLAPATP